MDSGAAIGTHTDFEPARISVEHTAAEFQRHYKRSVVHRHGGKRERSGNGVAAGTGGGVVKCKSQIKSSRGGTAILRETALIGEGGALAADQRNMEDKGEEKQDGFRFHGAHFLCDPAVAGKSYGKRCQTRGKRREKSIRCFRLKPSQSES